MNVLTRNLKWIVFSIVLFFAQNAFAQVESREYIRKAIEEWGECRNVAITETNGDLALYQDNGCAYNGCPEDLTEILKELNEKNEYIDDVQLTEKGKWILLYGDNGLRWSNIPSSLEARLKEYNEKAEIITSVTFNDAGDWIVVSTNYFSASDPEIEKWLKEGNEKYGKLWAACVTEDAVVTVYEEGFQFTGNIPDSLQKALENTKLDICRLKISGSSWFFANKEGEYEYDM